MQLHETQDSFILLSVYMVLISFFLMMLSYTKPNPEKSEEVAKSIASNFRKLPQMQDISKDYFNVNKSKEEMVQEIITLTPEVSDVKTNTDLSVITIQTPNYEFFYSATSKIKEIFEDYIFNLSNMLISYEDRSQYKIECIIGSSYNHTTRTQEAIQQISELSKSFKISGITPDKVQGALDDSITGKLIIKIYLK